MIIGDRLRTLREKKKLSQRDIEQRSGLLRRYISRVENHHTFPAIETLEKIARALEVPIYQLFCEGEEAAELSAKVLARARSGEERDLSVFYELLSPMEDGDRQLLLFMAPSMALRKRNSPQSSVTLPKRRTESVGRCGPPHLRGRRRMKRSRGYALL